MSPETVNAVLYALVSLGMLRIAWLRHEQRSAAAVLLASMWALVGLRITVRWWLAAGHSLGVAGDQVATSGSATMTAVLLLVAVALVLWEGR